MYIYHITSRDQWESSKAGGAYTPAAYDKDGFIHCSTAKQVRPVAQKFYLGQKSLIILEIDAATLGKAVVFENLDGGSELFPHIYCPLPAVSVLQIYDLPLGSDQSFLFPPLFA